MTQTKTVILYADLYPDWHEQPNACVWATAQPTSEKPAGDVLRVKIVVDLPEHPRVYKHDVEATGAKVVV